jgi:hypothetical protein
MTQELPVLQSGQPCFRDGLTIVPGQSPFQFSGQTLVDQNLHRDWAITRAFACSREQTAASRVTVGKSSRNSSRVWPASRYSTRVWNGTRVPQKTGVPPRISGSFTTTCSLDSEVAIEHSRTRILPIALRHSEEESPTGGAGEMPEVRSSWDDRVKPSAVTPHPGPRARRPPRSTFRSAR